jgi:hypothetical protein
MTDFVFTPVKGEAINQRIGDIISFAERTIIDMGINEIFFVQM